MKITRKWKLRNRVGEIERELEVSSKRPKQKVMVTKGKVPDGIIVKVTTGDYIQLSPLKEDHWISLLASLNTMIMTIKEYPDSFKILSEEHLKELEEVKKLLENTYCNV